MRPARPYPCLPRLLALLLLLAARAAAGEVTVFPAPGPGAVPVQMAPAGPPQAAPSSADSPMAGGALAAPRLHIYSALDLALARPLIRGFQAAHPGVAVVYEDMLTGEIHDRIVAETDAGGTTADFAFSSAMDLQVKLANDGYARPVIPAEAEIWPRWAQWRGRLWALTFEPAVFVYNRAAFADQPPPATRDELLRWLDAHPDEVRGRVGTYDIAQAGAGFLLMARDQEHFADIWRIFGALGRAGARVYPTSGEILERVADGRLILGYNILGGYAALWARDHPQVGLALPRDYTVVIARTGLVPRAAAAPELGASFLEFLMSEPGQEIMARELDLPAVHPRVTGEETAGALLTRFGTRLRPVPLGPGLLVYLDAAKRARLTRDWARALAARPAD